ncbi:hypothetical protein [Metabacillus sp. FJAT-53654]|uniref:5-bromo-4-chloroindolyl phosphate hydrolysis protein n=1 Tax=Metabacillus rhizosphaerae TaxID=3117747 RepID=A0ABZ2MYA2_9BACI
MKYNILRYLPYFFLFTVIIIDIVIIYALLVTLKILEKEIIAALIGFVGSVLGGLLTLVGVKWTLDSQNRKESLLKYEKANYVFTELLPKLIAVYNGIKSLSPQNWFQTIDAILKDAKALETKASELSEEARFVGIEFYREVKSIDYYAGVISEYLENIRPGVTDEEIQERLFTYYQGLAKADNAILNLVYKIKHS